MESQKTLEVIERIKNMSEKEISILEIFMAGFRAGMRTLKTEMESCQVPEQSHQTA